MTANNNHLQDQDKKALPVIYTSGILAGILFSITCCGILSAFLPNAHAQNSTKPAKATNFNLNSQSTPTQTKTLAPIQLQSNVDNTKQNQQYNNQEVITFTNSGIANEGWMKGKFRVDRIGDIFLKEGIAYIDGTRINIWAIPQYYETPRIVLTGFVLKTEEDTERINNSAKEYVGLAYFYEGEYTEKFPNPDGQDLIFKHDGSVHGRITSLGKGYITINCKTDPAMRIPVDHITLIRSPKAYTFTLSSTPSGDTIRTQYNGASEMLQSASGKAPLLVFKSTDPNFAIQTTTIIGEPPKKKFFFSSTPITMPMNPEQNPDADTSYDEDEENSDDIPVKFNWKQNFQR